MGAPPRLLNWLSEADDPAVDQAMAEALSTADDEAVAQIAQVLLERDRPAGLTGLVAAWDRLPPRAQQMVIDQADRLDRPLRETAGRGAIQGRRCVIQIIHESLASRHSYLVTEQLRHGPEAIHAEAAACLLHLARAASTRTGPDGWSGVRLSPRRARFVQEAVEDAAIAFGHHRQRDVLRAVCELSPRPVPRVTAFFADSHAPGLPALRELLEQADDPATRRSLLVLLPIHTLTGAIVAGVRRAAEQGRLQEVIESASLAALPRVARALRRCVDVDRLLPSPQQITGYTPAQARALPRWLMAMPLPMERRVHELAQARATDDPLARLTALHSLIAVTHRTGLPDAAEAIAHYVGDPDPRIARIAVRALHAIAWPGLHRLMLRLINSPHEGVRQLAAEHLAPLGFERLWRQWPELAFAQRLEIGRALVKIDPAFHRKIARRIQEGDVDERHRGLSIIHGLNQGAFFEGLLIDLIQDEDVTLVASAVKALGAAGSPLAERTVKDLLDHPDPRVRANAVEALEQLEATDHVQKLVAMANDEEEAGRPRANAIGALLKMRTRDALSALAQMLHDPRADRRRSALWLVEQGGVVDVARQVVEMSLADQDDDIRRRAGETVHRLIHQLEDGPFTGARAGAKAGSATTRGAAS